MKGRSAGIGVGTISILAIFVILCLTMFATLSMVSARSELALAERTAEAAALYYQADTAAQEALAALLEDPQAAGWEHREDGVFYSVFPVAQDRELQVQALILPDGKLEILRYQVVSIREESGDVPLPVLTEEDLFDIPDFG